MAHPKYGEDLAAMRATDEEVLGSGLKPTSQPRHNIEWEEGVSELLGSNPRYPDEEMHEVTHHGVKYLMRPDGKVQFPIKEGDKGVWLARPTESDASPGGLFTHRDADKLVFVRGKPESLRGMGRAYERNSDEARENVAEMFLQRKKPIDPDRLVQVPIPKDKQMWQVLRDLGLTGGTDKHGRSKWGSKIPIKKFFPLRGVQTALGGAATRGASKAGAAGASKAGAGISSGRQTTLGEHHPDFPSPHGDVKYFHGTSGDRVPGIQTEGLKPASKLLPHQGKLSPPSPSGTMSAGDATWVTPHQGLAEGYATQRSSKRFMNEVSQPGGDLASPTQNPTVFGVREAAGQPVRTMGGANYFSEGVKPEHLTKIPWDGGAEYSKLVGNRSDFATASPTPNEYKRGDGLNMGEPMDIAFQLLKMSDYEADEYQDRLEERANRRFDPQSRRKIQSMGQRESKPRFSRFSNRKTILDDRKQKERDLKLRRERAIMGLDLPYSFHGFGADDREIHPGEEENYTEEMWKKLQSMRGKVRSPNVGRVKRPMLIESPEDLSRLFGGQSVGIRPGDYFYDDSFGDDDDDDDDESESVSFSFGSDNDRNLFAAHLADIPQMGLDDRSFWGDYEPSLSDIGEGIFENRKRPWTTSGPINYIPQTEEWVNNPLANIPTNRGIPFREGTGFTTGEPMDIAYQLLKDRKSPEAWAHKLEYDKQYQKNPKRVKYREQLNAERRKRGIYGKGGGDVSHTQGGKLTLENPSSNRARHFKGKGTLRRVKVR